MSRFIFKLFVIILTMFILMGTFGCANSPKPAVEGPQGKALFEPIELKLAHFWPAVHPVDTQLAQGWKKAIEEATGELVKIKIYPGETLLRANDIYEGVATGVADVGISCFNYTPGRFQIIECFEQPGVVYKNAKISDYIVWEGIKELQPKEIEDTQLMMVFTTGPSHLLTINPIRTLEDIKGLELRAFSMPQSLEALGAVPVIMSQAEAYEALARGIVQGNLAPLDVLQGFRQAEVTKYITLTPFINNAVFFMTMNLDVWNTIPSEIQATILEVNEIVFEEIAAGLWDKACSDSLEYAIKEYGHEVIELSDEEFARWMGKLTPLKEEYVKSLEEKGLPGQEIMETIERLSDKYNEIYS